jgi:Sigma-70 region 2
MRSASSSSRTAASSTPTATACSARRTTPTTRFQETLLRAWRGLAGFDTARPLRPWLYRIATNVCLDAIAKRPKRVLPVDYGPPAGEGDGPGEPVVELIWLEPYPDETLGLESGLAAPTRATSSARASSSPSSPRFSTCRRPSVRC